MQRVLIIDDNEAVCTALQVLFDLNEISSATASSPEEGLDLARRELFGLIVQDMNFTEDSTSGEEGIRLFHQLRTIDPFMPILLITAWSSLETAVSLVKQGAQDYLSKPWDDEKLVQKVRQLLAARGRSPLARAGGGISGANLCGMIYEDPATHRLVSTAVQIAAADVPILITGPNGAGKEILADILQANSPRRNGPFVKVNAGALPNELVESELFGVEPGAFTGAQKRRIGRFEQAHGGTLFLDEIANLPLGGQIKLLRVLQTGEFSRLGSNQVVTVNTRVISATNANLAEAIAAGAFREDLFFRLNVVELNLPGLAQRPADILPLAHHFLRILPGGGRHELGTDAELALSNHDWPGNVRELRNRIQRALLMSPTPLLSAQHLGLALAESGNDHSDTDLPTQAESSAAERARIERALRRARGNVSKAAAEVGLSRQALYRRMEKFGIIWEKQPR